MSWETITPRTSMHTHVLLGSLRPLLIVRMLGHWFTTEIFITSVPKQWRELLPDEFTLRALRVGDWCLLVAVFFPLALVVYWKVVA